MLVKQKTEHVLPLLSTRGLSGFCHLGTGAGGRQKWDDDDIHEEDYARGLEIRGSDIAMREGGMGFI